MYPFHVPPDLIDTSIVGGYLVRVHCLMHRCAMVRLPRTRCQALHIVQAMRPLLLRLGTRGMCCPGRRAHDKRRSLRARVLLHAFAPVCPYIACTLASLATNLSPMVCSGVHGTATVWGTSASVARVSCTLVWVWYCLCWCWECPGGCGCFV